MSDTHKIQTDIFDVQGYLTFGVYIYYFLPGSVQLKTKLYTVRLGQIAKLISQINRDILAPNTRRKEVIRWLPKSEMPYPGYCRAPGSSECLDVLCNCQALDEKWAKFIEQQKKMGKLIKIQSQT